MIYSLYTDGGSRGNPGPAAMGGLLKDAHGSVIAEFSQTLGDTTNNQAEYRSFITGLELALKHKVVELTCFLDSELIVKQLTGLYKIKDQGLRIHAQRAHELIAEFSKVSFRHIPREQNSQADALVNKALDGV